MVSSLATPGMGYGLNVIPVVPVTCSPDQYPKMPAVDEYHRYQNERPPTGLALVGGRRIDARLRA